MLSLAPRIASTLKTGMIHSFALGFGIGLFPFTLHLQINKKRYWNLPVPLFSGCLGVVGFLGSPFLLTQYMTNGTLLERWLDQWIEKYDVSIERHHQYLYPSIVYLTEVLMA